MRTASEPFYRFSGAQTDTGTLSEMTEAGAGWLNRGRIILVGVSVYHECFSAVGGGSCNFKQGGAG